MTINLTLLIQVCHFFVAYLILKYLFFTPSLRVVIEEQSYKDALTRKRDDARVALQEMQHYAHNRWHHSRKELGESIPEYEIPLRTFNVQPLTLHEVTQREKDRLVRKLTESVVEKVDG